MPTNCTQLRPSSVRQFVLEEATRLLRMNRVLRVEVVNRVLRVELFVALVNVNRNCHHEPVCTLFILSYLCFHSHGNLSSMERNSYNELICYCKKFLKRHGMTLVTKDDLINIA